MIAIDTSASVRGEFVSSFISHTIGILSDTDAVPDHFHVKIVQCDNWVRDVRSIYSKGDLQAYASDVVIRGLGNTDFRPVFELVNTWIDKGELELGCGLIYFTDGDGIYPEEKPDHDTVFVICGDADISAKMPDWAKSLIITEGEITDD